MSLRLFFFLIHKWELQQTDLEMLLDSWIHPNSLKLTFSIIQQYLSFWQVRAVLIKLHPRPFCSLGSSMGRSSVQQTQQAQRRELLSGSHRQCKRSPFQVGNLAQGWTTLLGSSWLIGTCGKGTKECWQWDGQTGKTVTLALDTQETQGFFYN